MAELTSHPFKKPDVNPDYRADIDGLRAIALLPVMGYHAGFEGFKGGYLGVDIFLVISGYLITRLILKEADESQFSFFGFLERRARRLLPALLLVILCISPFAWVWMLPDALENYGQSVVASLFFGNNILLYLTAGYWDLEAQFKPLLHTWSLAIEEQYYLFFPLLVMGLWKLGRRGLWVVFALLFVLSGAAWLWAMQAAPEAAFYLLPFRGWEFLLGSFCALRSVQLSRWPSELFALLGGILILWSLFVTGGHDPILGRILVCLGSVLLIQVLRPGLVVHWLLARPVLVGLGLISYSAYLWHQPVLALAGVYSAEAPSDLFLLGLLGMAIVLGWASWRYVEGPFRDRDIVSRRSFLVTVLFIGAVLAGFGLAAHQSKGFPARVWDPELVPQAQMGPEFNMQAMAYRAPAFQTDKARVLVIGNSYARDWVHVLREGFDHEAMEIVYRNDRRVCDLASSANVIFVVTPVGPGKFECVDRQSAVYYVGSKTFGANLNWIARIDPANRALLRNPPDTARVQAEKKTAGIIGPRYLSVQPLLENADGVVITDQQGRPLSHDGFHLTQWGAEFVADGLVKRGDLTDVLPARVNGD